MPQGRIRTDRAVGIGARSPMTGGEVLQDRPDRPVVRVGGTVRHPRQPWTPSVHALLRHLAGVGFRYAPRVVGVDGDDDAYALEYLAPFRGDEDCVRWMRYPAPPDRRRRLELFATAYGLTGTDGLADRVIARQRATLDLVRRLAAQGHARQRDALAAGEEGETAARIRWSEEHRHLFA